MNKDGEIDIMDLQRWILKAEPRDRTHAFPLLVVAKEILSKIVAEKYKIISNRVRELEQSVSDVHRHYEEERTRIVSVDQDLSAAMAKIERKRARSRALKQRYAELAQAYNLKHNLPPDHQHTDPRTLELEAQLRALRDALAAQRRDADLRLEAQRAAAAEQVAAVREESQRSERLVKRLELEKARLAAAAQDAYGPGALGRLSAEQFRGLAAALLAVPGMWEGLDAAQAAGILQGASGPARELLLRGILEEELAASGGSRLAGARVSNADACAPPARLERASGAVHNACARTRARAQAGRACL